MTDYLKTIQQLEQKIKNQKHQITIFQKCLEEKNKELDALHYVWCNGGCKGGVHRYHKEPLTKELVERAKRNTNRLIDYYNNIEFRKLYTPQEKEINLIKTEMKDVWFYFSIVQPRKLYHKILKFFSDLVEF